MSFDRVTNEKKNKFNAKKVTTPEGDVFDSRKEYNRWNQLRRMEMDGEISDLRRQVVYELSKPFGKRRAIKYIADFVYLLDGKTVVEDVKGYRHGASYSVFRVKSAWMHEKYGIEVIET